MTALYVVALLGSALSVAVPSVERSRRVPDGADTANFKGGMDTVMLQMRHEHERLVFAGKASEEKAGDEPSVEPTNDPSADSNSTPATTPELMPTMVLTTPAPNATTPARAATGDEVAEPGAPCAGRVNGSANESCTGNATAPTPAPPSVKGT